MQLQSWAMAGKLLEINIVQPSMTVLNTHSHQVAAFFSGQIESQQKDSAIYIGMPIGAEYKALLPRDFSRNSCEIH